MTDPLKVLATIDRAALLFRATPGRKGSIISLQDADEVMVVGDLHGHVHTFGRVVRKAALDNHPGRHLVLQELVHDPRVRPDEGEIDRSHRLVDLVCALKCQYPTRVHVLLGNHELSELTGRSIGKNGVFLNVLFRQGIEATYGDHAPKFVAAYSNLFASLPLAVRTPNRVLLCHTLPDLRSLDSFHLDVLDKLPWPDDALRRGGTVYSFTWGRDTSPELADRFAQLMDVDLFITGHHPCDDGYHQANHRHLIIDATDPKPYCCTFYTQTPVAMSTLLAGISPLTPSTQDE